MHLTPIQRRPARPWLPLVLFIGPLAGCGRNGPDAVPEQSGPSATDRSGESGADPRPSATGPVLPDRAAERGLSYVNRSGRPEKPTILEANGAGVALLDLGGDGDLDIAFSQGLVDLDALLEGPGADLELFGNDGSGSFEALDGPGLDGWWTGLVAGDLDADGRDDLVAGGFGDLRALLQTEDGRLVPRAEDGLQPTAPGARLIPGEPRAAGLPPAWTTSCALVDLNLDGILDLYAGRYLDLDPVEPALDRLGQGALSVPCRWKGHPVYCGPRGMTAQPDRVFLGVGDGAFVDETEQRLPNHFSGFTLGVAAFDADLDGDQDLYVANDSVPNLLLINSAGVLRDAGLQAGVGLNQDGMPEAGMGIAVGDVNRDGLFDLAVTNFSDEPTQLFLGAKVGFKTATYRLGLSAQTRRLLSWGVHLEDFDGDGFLELFTANGHVYPQADEPDTGTRYGQPASLWQLGPYAKVRAVDPGGPESILAPALGARGSAVGDLDGDGDPDLVLARIDGPAALGINSSPRGNRLLVRALGSSSPSEDAPARRTPPGGEGAVLICVPAFAPGTPETSQFALLGEVRRGAGFQSSSSPWVHFGLGDRDRLERLEIRWPSGRVEVLEDIQAGLRLTIREGEGIVKSEELP